VAVVTVILERAIFWIDLRRKRNHLLVNEMLKLAEEGDWDTIRTRIADSKDHIIRLLVVGIVHREYDMGRAMESEATQILQGMKRFMPVLDTMITVAPLLGIFGTVLGIIASFHILGSKGIADPRLVTTGIAQALITTATGLGIAIIAVIPYNFFNSRIEGAMHVMEKYATSLEVVYEKLEQRP
jgi:biopolymer transport protein ExbB